MTNDIVLLHGGAHGSWCWEKLTPLLEPGGARVTSPDLPLSDPTASFEVCLEAIQAAVPSDLDSPLVVAHSASGSYLPLAAQALNARKMVFLCAVLPQDGASWLEQMLANPDSIGQPPPPLEIDERGRVVFPPETAREVFFHDCSPADQEFALERLVPFAQTIPAQTLPAGTMAAAPDAEYVLGTLDRSLNPTWLRGEAERRFGKPVIEIKTGHSPFLADPEGLAELLLDV